MNKDVYIIVLRWHQHPGETQNQLAERIALDRNSCAEMLRRMIGRGLLRRVPAQTDRRAYSIYVTPKGEALLREVLPHDLVVEARVIAPLPVEYRPLFIKCLKILVGLEPAPQAGARLTGGVNDREQVAPGGRSHPSSHPRARPKTTQTGPSKN